MSVGFTEIPVRGKAITVPCACIQGRTVIVTGKRIEVAALKDEDLVEGEPVSTPESFVSDLRHSDLKADVFTFAQRVPEVTPRYKYHLEWDNRAVIPITTFGNWLEKRVEYDVRKAVKRAERLGLVVKTAVFDDAFAEGIRGIYNESPVRQNKAFWHYLKDIETVKQENGTYLDRSEFIGAYYEGELIGFIKLVYVGRIACTLQVISQKKHSNKKPTNALLAKAVAICERRGVSHLVYGSYTYKGQKSPLTEFKRRNGFEQILLPRYYVPLTSVGRVALRLGLHRGLAEQVPEPVRALVRRARSLWYDFKLNSPTPIS